MTQLIRVELRRILSRKILHLSVVAILAVLAITFYGLWQNTRPLADYQAEATANFEMAHQDWESQQEGGQNEEMIDDCLAQQERERELSGDPSLDFGCVWEEPVLEQFLQDFGPPSMVEVYRQTLVETGLLVLFLALIGGSTASAGEVGHRTLGTWLTFEPRRDRVFFSKVLASGLAGLVMAAVFIAVLLAGIPTIYRIRGVDDALSVADWGDVGWMAARLALLALVLGMVGAAAGLLLQHTGAVLGVAIGYLMVVESMVNGLFTGLIKYLLSNNIFAWLRDGHEAFTYVCTPSAEGGEMCQQKAIPISLEHGALVIAVVALVVILVSWLLFRRRDIN